jgi:V/A-type H+-transporting ATPase subunit I
MMLMPQKTCSRAELKTRIERELPGIEREVEELTTRRSKLDTRVKEYEQKIAEITPFVRVPVDLDLYHGYKDSPFLPAYVPRSNPFSPS